MLMFPKRRTHVETGLAPSGPTEKLWFERASGRARLQPCRSEPQGKDGMWRQLVDHPEAWPETSSTGIKNGGLDPATYGPAARKGWLALVGYIDQNADVTSVCEGTGKKNDLDYYLARARRTGDFHGQAPVLWCASALLR